MQSTAATLEPCGDLGSTARCWSCKRDSGAYANAHTNTSGNERGRPSGPQRRSRRPGQHQPCCSLSCIFGTCSTNEGACFIYLSIVYILHRVCHTCMQVACYYSV